MMVVPKPNLGPNDEKKQRTIIDKCEINDNTIKLASPLPNIEIILMNVLKHKYKVPY
jgi:hypothetical protein